MLQSSLWLTLGQQVIQGWTVISVWLVILIDYSDTWQSSSLQLSRALDNNGQPSCLCSDVSHMAHSFISSVTFIQPL